MATSTPSSSRKPSSKPNPLTNAYLFLYNFLSLSLWATLTIRLIPLLIPRLLTLATTGTFPTDSANDNDAPALFATLFSPHLLYTQSLAALEILHSIFGLVRAPVITTAMQVASRLLVVWGILWMFASEEGFGGGEGVIMGGGGGVSGEVAFVGCLVAWGVTECIRYGFFALQVGGKGIPGWLTWLRYNTFYVLYPTGISSECWLIFLALGPAREFSPLYQWFLISVLVVYIPGSYILYTHMMAQRRKATNKKRAN
ncbi:hypothetical protein FQN54_006586 [Arachnomyces sp. PD_36]|nr:hypothetical protein FQN54_006586 [Arachnomyces sp. PD_36]